MTLGGVSGPILLEDLNDLADIAEHLNRTVSRRLWVDEFRNADQVAVLESMF